MCVVVSVLSVKVVRVRVTHHAQHALNVVYRVFDRCHF